MNGRDIPGYYYDREKKKYFKIQASSTSPSSSAYSSQDVKRRKTRDAQSEAIALAIARRKGRIRRPKILEDPLAGTLLGRECGQRHLDAAQIFSSGLEARGKLATMTEFFHSSAPIFNVDHRLDLGPAIVDFRIVLDDQLLTIRANCDENPNSTTNNCVEICDQTVQAVDNASWRIERFGSPGPSTSLSVHQVRRRLAMTWLAGDNHSGIVVSPMNGIPVDGDADRPNILLGPGHRHGADVSIYSSAAAPPGSSNLFAFGSSHGILTMEQRDYDTHWHSPKPDLYENSYQDIFALEFLHDNHSILLSGGRKGILNITDLRIPESAMNRDVINHPSSITHIKQIDSHRILVAGLNSSLCQYDLRFRKAGPAAPNPKKLKSVNNLTTTTSILQYIDFRNDATIQFGFDVDLETGVVAAAQRLDEAHPPVQLFSLHGAQKLRPLPDRGQGNCMQSKCLLFARDNENMAKSLFVENGISGISRYAWVAKKEGSDDAKRIPRLASIPDSNLTS